MSNKVYGYARVSTKEQNLDRQLTALKEYGVNDRDIITDKSSGKDFNREGYIMLVDKLLRKGDILVIKELDRLGRNMKQVKEQWQELQLKGIDIVVIDNPILNTANKSDLEKTLISNIVFELLSYMAEKERAKLKRRQEEGMIEARAKGVKFGRPNAKYPTNWEGIYNTWKAGEIMAVTAMEILDLRKSTFYNLVKQYENRK